MNTLIVPLVGLAVVFVGLVVLIAIVKLMGVICGFVTGRRAETSGSVSSSGIEAEKVAADGNAQKLTGESRRELIAVISAAIAETIGTDAARASYQIHQKKSVEPHRFLRSIMFGANKTGCIALMHYILADIRKGH